MKTFKQFVEGNVGLDLVKGLVRGGIKTGIAGAGLYLGSVAAPHTEVGRQFTKTISNTLNLSPYGRAAMDVGSKAKEKIDKNIREPIWNKVSPTLKSVDDYVKTNYPASKSEPNKETTNAPMPPRRPTKLK